MQRRLLAVPLLLAACAPAPGSESSASPAARVELVGDGVLSTAANEYNPSLSPDGRTLVFARSEPDFRSTRTDAAAGSALGNGQSDLYRTRASAVLR